MRPILIAPTECDASKAITFTFTAKTIISQAEIFVYKNDDNLTQVYTNKINTTTNSITIPANSGLENGEYYVAQLFIYDYSGNKSDSSNYVDFTCYSTPQLTLNITEGQVIPNSSYVVQLTYSQAQNDDLSFYSAVVTKNSTGEIVFETGRIFAYNTMNFAVNGLDNNESYTISVTGETVSGMSVVATPVSFSIQYARSAVYSLLDIHHDAATGIVYVDSMIDVVTGKTGNGEDPEFIDGEKVDLSGDDSSVIFDSGFEMGPDYTVKIQGESLKENSQILEMVDEDGLVHEIRFMKGNFEQFQNAPKIYLEYIIHDYIPVVWLSNYLDPLQEGEELFLWIRRKDSFVDLKIEKVT